MHTREFCELVSKRLPGLKREDVHTVLHAIIEEAQAQLREGEEVRLPGLGKLHVKKMRGVFKVRFSPYSGFQEQFDRTFVENRDAADLAR